MTVKINKRSSHIMDLKLLKLSNFKSSLEIHKAKTVRHSDDLINQQRGRLE